MTSTEAGTRPVVPVASRRGARPFAVLPADDPLAWRPDYWDASNEGAVSAEAQASLTDAGFGWDTAADAPSSWEAALGAPETVSSHTADLDQAVLSDSTIDPWWDDLLRSLDELSI